MTFMQLLLNLILALTEEMKGAFDILNQTVLNAFLVDPQGLPDRDSLLF